MAALKNLGDLLDASGWTGDLVLAGVATTGTADSILKQPMCHALGELTISQPVAYIFYCRKYTLTTKPPVD